MDDKLLKKYLEYASTEEAFAVLFVKKHFAQAKGHWVDIVDCRRYEMSSDNLHFRFVVGGLYERKIQPQYPSKSAYTIDGKFDERRYYLMAEVLSQSGSGLSLCLAWSTNRSSRCLMPLSAMSASTFMPARAFRFSSLW